MKHHQTRTVLLVLAIVTTTLFIVEITVDVASIAGTPVVAIVWTIAAMLLLPVVLLLLCVIVVNTLHGYIMEWEDREEARKQKQGDREHHYQYNRAIRELELEQYRQLLRPRRYRVKCYARHHRQLKRRHKVG